MSDPIEKPTTRTELVAAKISAGLSREQAEAVVDAQAAEDAAAEKASAAKSKK